MKKNFNILNLCLILAVLIGDVFYIVYDTILIKSITSAGFVALAAINLYYAIKLKTPHKKFCITMLVGLFFAMMGDIILEIHFISGAALFAVGHVFYFVAYTFLVKFKWEDLIYAIVILVVVVPFILFVPIFDFGGVFMQLVCIAYAVVISCMVSKSISNFVQNKSRLNLIVMIGSILFMFSDLMLLLNVFASLPVVGILCLATYYPAECMLAYSILEASEK